MPKLLKICSLRSFLRLFPRQNYCIFRHIHKNNLPLVSATTFKEHQYSYSILSSPQDASEIEIKQLLTEFPEPKKIISHALSEAFLLDQSLDIKPCISHEQLSYGNENEFVWKATLQMKWPEVFDVEGVARKKADAEHIAFLYACRKLKKLGVLDSTNKPRDKFSITDRNVKIAKGDLLNVFQRIWIRYGKKEYIPKFNMVPLEVAYGGSKYWKTQLCLTFPENKVFEATATRLKDAENIAADKALQWLISQGVINRSRKLVQYTKADEAKLQELQQAPYSISIPQKLQEKMQDVISDLEKQKSLLLNRDFLNCEIPIREGPSAMNNMISDNIYHEPNQEELYKRSQELFEYSKRFENYSDPNFLAIQNVRAALPISQKRDEILKLIDENQVVVLSGETGCGKSTQVPQFILDYFISQKKGAECNIVVTQPRRISAVSLADRVSKERGEQIGQTVGHQIRLNRCLPPNNGAILYCTTGVLLRKICSNPNFEGISHIIVDEVHERSIHIDFLLILLKNVLENNKNTKLVLMSASFNTQLFSHYFNNAPVINVPGKNYHVKEFFLEDLVKHIPELSFVEDSRTPTLNTDLLISVINHIDKTQQPGAILCFLPGWHDIREVHCRLLETEKSTSKFFICPIHSRLPTEEQKKIFIKPSDGRRKIILATNVAETSITGNDGVYVVNSGLHKGTSLDVEAGIATLTVQWITKANVRQRRGRAGRVQPGICYHLFSRRTLMEMNEYPVAEILRVPLEKVILDCKLHCPDIKAEEFLSKAIQPPPPNSIQSGVNDLIALGILDKEEELTDLGKVIVQFGTHPRLSVALIYAAFLGCIDPVLTICATLTVEKEPFINTLDDKIKIKKIKQLFDNGLCSDHLALNKIYQRWNYLYEENDIIEYNDKYLLDDQCLLLIKSLKQLFAEDLSLVGVISGTQSHCDRNCQWNIHSFHVPSILAALTAAFFPNVIRVNQGEISHGKLFKDNIVYSLIKGQKAYIQKESVVADEVELPTPWLVYFSAMKSEARRLAMVSSVSSVPGIGLLLLAGNEISVISQPDNSKQENSVLLIDDYKKLNFCCTEKEAQLLLDWRNCMRDIFKLYLKSLKKWNCEEHEFMLFCKNKFLQTMKELLETPQVPFTKGQVYEFVNSNLVEKDL